MQERVTPTAAEFAELVIQHQPDLMSVGIGLEPPTSEVPDRHFIDRLYGDVPTQTKIGTILFDRLQADGVIGPMDFRTSDEAAEFMNRLGRAVLDAVTGVATFDGLWTWFDRPAVNRLIRLLRKARDSAFGADA